MTTTAKPAKPGVPRPGRGASALAGFTPPVAPPPTAAPPADVAAPEPTPEPAAPEPTPAENSPALSDPVNTLVSGLTGSDKQDGERAGHTNGHGTADFMRAMLGGAVRVDPMLDREQIGPRIPRHYVEALRLMAFARRCKAQDLVVEALTAYIPPDLLAEALAAVRGRPR